MSQSKRLTAADIMTTQVVTRGSHDDLTRIATEMQRHQIGSVVIMDNKKMVGILTERDFVRIVERIGTLLERGLAKDHMTSPVLTVQSDAPLADVVKLMTEKHVRHLIVLNKDREMAGIISSRDLMKVTKEAVSV
jgi:CBS domain-containing protein